MAATNALLGFLLPGFPEARAGRTGRAAALLGLSVLAHAAALFTLRGVALLAGARLAAAVLAGVGGRRPAPGPSVAWLAGLAAGLGPGLFLALWLAMPQFHITSSSMTPTLVVGDHVFAERVTPLWSPPGRGEVITFHHPCTPSRDYAKRVVAVAGDTVEIRCAVLYVNGAPVKRELRDARCTYDDYDDMDDRWYARSCTRYRETLGDRAYDVLGAAPGSEPETRGDFPDPDVLPIPPSCAELAKDSGIPGVSVTVRDEAPLPQHAGAIVDGPTRPVDPCAPRVHYVVPEDSLFVLGDNRPNSNDSRFWGVVPLAAVIGRVVGIAWTSGPSGPSGRVGDVR